MTVVFVHGHPHRKCTDGPDGARCDVCREARRRWFAQRRDERRALLEADPSIRPHGDVTTYQAWGCRCQPCTTAATTLRAKYGKYRNGEHIATVHRGPRTPPFGREWLDGDTKDSPNS